MTEDITLLRKGYCDVRGIIRFNPSVISPFGQFSVYKKDGTPLGIVNPLTHEDRKVLEEFSGKYVRFRSLPPVFIDSEKTFTLHLEN